MQQHLSFDLKINRFINDDDKSCQFELCCNGSRTGAILEYVRTGIDHLWLHETSLFSPLAASVKGILVDVDCSWAILNWYLS